MTDQQLQDALAEAASRGATKAIELHATAIRAAVGSPRTKHTSPWVVAGLVIGLLSPVGVAVGWINSVSSRVSVLEASDTAMRTKVDQLGDLSTQLAAVKQELSDFRSDFEEFKTRATLPPR